MKASIILVLAAALALASAAAATPSHQWYGHLNGAGKPVCDKGNNGTYGPFQSKAACQAAFTPAKGWVCDDGQSWLVDWPNAWLTSEAGSGEATGGDDDGDATLGQCDGDGGGGSIGAPEQAPKPGGMAVYLCHGQGYNPVVWSNQDAAALLAQGDWFSPEASPGNVAGGDNVGVYHLDCNNGFGTGFENTADAALYVDHNGTLRDLNAAELSVAGQYPVAA